MTISFEHAGLQTAKLSLISFRHTSFWTLMSLNFSQKLIMSFTDCPLERILSVQAEIDKLSMISRASFVDNRVREQDDNMEPHVVNQI